MSYGLDPDEAGRKGIYKLGNFLQEHKKQNINIALIPEGKDVNDLTYEEFKQVQIISFNEWKRWYENKILSSE
jgi:DNA primase